MSSVKDIYSLDAEYYSAYRYEEEVKRVENNRFVTKILFFTLLIVSLFLVYKYFLNHYEALSKYISVPSFLTAEQENFVQINENKIIEKRVNPIVITADTTVEETLLQTPTSYVETEESRNSIKKLDISTPSISTLSKERVVSSSSIESQDLSPEYIELIQKSLGK